MSTSEAEQLVSEKHEVLYKCIKRLDVPYLNWTGVVEDLEELSWLVESNNTAKLISALWTITEKNAKLALKGTTRFKVLKVSCVKVFISTLAHTLSDNPQDLKELVTLCKKHIDGFAFFTNANLLLKASKNVAADFTRVVAVFEESKDQLSPSFTHLDKASLLESDKSISRQLKAAFYDQVITPNLTLLNSTPSIAMIVDRYTINTATPHQSTAEYSPSSSYSYHCESAYLGELGVGNTRQGFGKCNYFNKDTYQGFWNEDKPHGLGIYRWKNGGRYEGNFVKGKMQGKGKRIFASGAVYIGDFDNSKKHGTGKISFKNGDSYEGEWNSDFMSGNGIYTWHTGDRFTGTFRRDKREGFGVLTLKSGESVSGEWVCGKMQLSNSTL